MKTTEKLIQQNIQGKKVLFIFVLTNIVYLTMILSTIPKVMAYGNGMKLLDMMPMGYDIEYVQTLFDSLGEHGREAYLINQIPLDMIYPFLFAICYCLVLGFFLKKLGKLKTPILFFCLLPFLVGLMDYAENIGIIYMLQDHPKISSNAVTITSGFSLLKSICTTLYFVILIILFVLLGIRTWRK